MSVQVWSYNKRTVMCEIDFQSNLVCDISLATLHQNNAPDSEKQNR